MPDGSPITPAPRRFPLARAFTLIELLVVIAIVAILLSILISGLSRARELGRITKCEANQRTIVQAVQGFAVEHQGFGQLVVPAAAVKNHRARPKRHVYEEWPGALRVDRWPYSNVTGPVLSPWPVAYSSYLGANGLTSEDLYVNSPALVKSRSKTKVRVLQCPSDRDRIISNHLGVWGAYSYAFSYNIFGPERQRRRGRSDVIQIGGRLDRVFRPFDVLMFVDGGGRDYLPEYASHHTFGGGPRWSDRAVNGRWTRKRHSAKGGLVGAFVDGHVEYLRPVAWKWVNWSRRPVRYAPDPRISAHGP